MTPRLILREVRETVRESLWFWPTVAIALGLAGGLSLPGVSADPAGRAAFVLFPGDTDAARNVLATILGATLTVTGVTFSVTIAVLQNASQQFSPRLLRSFIRDASTQAAMGTMLATFAFTLAAILRLGQGDDSPAVAVTTVLGLTLVAIAALVHFIHHMSEEVRVEVLMLGVMKETLRVIANLEPGDGEHADPSGMGAPPEAVPVNATRSGYLQAIDRDTLTREATERGTVIQMRLAVGQHVVERSPLAWVWHPDGGTADEAALTDMLNAAVDIGFERSMEQDPAFGLRQLVDMGVKAISPAINDPRTTVEAVANLTVLLAALARSRLGPELRRDDEGAIRVAVPGRSFEGYLDLACGQIRRYGASEPAVTGALLGMLEEVALALDRGASRRRAAVAEQIEHIMLAAERATSDAADLDNVRLAAAAARAALRGTPSPVRPPVQS